VVATETLPVTDLVPFRPIFTTRTLLVAIEAGEMALVA
jgi:hypothetical protein